MRIIILKDNQAVADFGAQHIQNKLRQQPSSTLGLATGSSPIKLYEQLITAYKNNEVSFKDVTTFNLDEYLGLADVHPQSYRHFMNTQLFNHLDIKLTNTFVPDGSTTDPFKTCADYEELIVGKGGIDLQLLGIGKNGHIGFNEPSSSLASRTRVKTLSKSTVEANQHFFNPDEFQPYLSITMGIGSIMEAKEILLIATGETKANAIQQTVEGPLSAHCPASILQMHSKAIIAMDEDAAQQLHDIDFYKYVEKENQRYIKS